MGASFHKLFPTLPVEALLLRWISPTIPALLEVHKEFHNIKILAVQTNALKRSGSHSTVRLIGYTALKILKALMALAETANLARLSNFVFPFILFNPEMIRFIVLRKLEQGFALVSSRTIYCMKRVLSTMRLMRTRRFETGSTRWTLRFGSLPIST